jgi:hypothetical protein
MTLNAVSHLVANLTMWSILSQGKQNGTVSVSLLKTCCRDSAATFGQNWSPELNQHFH